MNKFLINPSGIESDKWNIIIVNLSKCISSSFISYPYFRYFKPTNIPHITSPLRYHFSTVIPTV